MTDWAWFMKRVAVSAFLVGWLWNGQLGEATGVYMVVLGLILLAAWIREARTAR